MAMPGKALSDYGSVKHVECCKQSCRAITLIVMGHRAAPALFHRQAWLRSIQSLNLALLIYAEYYGFIRRRKVQPNHISQLFDEPLVARKLERLDAMGLKAVRIPNPLDSAVANALGLGHGAAAPMSGVPGFGVQSGLYDLLDFLRRDSRLAPSPWAHLEQARD